MAAGHHAWVNYDGCFVFGDFSTSGEVRCDDNNRVVFRAVGGIFHVCDAELEARVNQVQMLRGELKRMKRALSQLAGRDAWVAVHATP